jgi:hypothetical protein
VAWRVFRDLFGVLCHWSDVSFYWLLERGALPWGALMETSFKPRHDFLSAGAE